LNEMIASVLSKPLPPLPTPITTLPATTPAATTPTLEARARLALTFEWCGGFAGGN